MDHAKLGLLCIIGLLIVIIETKWAIINMAVDGVLVVILYFIFKPRKKKEQ